MTRTTLRGAICLALLAGMLMAAGCGRRGGEQTQGAGPEDPAKVEVQARTIPVFCYHAMSPGATGTYEVPTEDFKEQLAALQEGGFETVTPTQIAEWLAGKAELPEKPACITFDDGAKSILTVSKPLMDEYGYVGAAFLNTDSVGGEGQMTWDDVRALQEAGWEIGSHSATHEHLTRISEETCREELEGSKADIDQEIEGECTSLAYPYGLYDDSVLEIVREVGYRIAFTIDRGPADQTDELLLMPREMVVNGNSMKTYRRWLAQEKLHVEDLDPPRGSRFDTTSVEITGRLGDEGVPPGEIEFTLDGKRIDVTVGDDGVSITLMPKLTTGESIIRANYYGSPHRETSWLVICDAE